MIQSLVAVGMAGTLPIPQARVALQHRLITTVGTEDGRVLNVATSTLKVAREIRVGGPVTAIVNLPGSDSLFVLVSMGVGTEIHELGAVDLQSRQIISVPTLPPALAAVVINGNDAFVLSGNPSNFQGTLIQLKTGKILSTVSNLIEGLLYQTAGLNSDYGIVAIPGAYPGEVVEVNVRDTANPVVSRRTVVNDWIHDVKLIAPDRAIVAGHLKGVGLIPLLQHEGEVPEPMTYLPLTNEKSAHLLLAPGRVIAASLGNLDIIEFGSLRVTRKIFEPIPSEVPEFQSGVLPIGLGPSDEVVLLQEGSGLITVFTKASQR